MQADIYGSILSKNREALQQFLKQAIIEKEIPIYNNAHPDVPIATNGSPSNPDLKKASDWVAKNGSDHSSTWDRIQTIIHATEVATQYERPIRS